MTLHITINDQTEQALRHQAAAQGQDLAAYQRETLERLADAEQEEELDSEKTS